MIRFFRQIRQRLLTENRFSKYLLYAIGEILLVVIGILIALQIDNWNEWKKERQIEQEVLQSLIKNLELNAATLQADINILNEFNQSAQIVTSVLENRAPFVDSLASHFHKARVPKFELSLSRSGYEQYRDKGYDMILNAAIKDEVINYFESSLPKWITGYTPVNYYNDSFFDYHVPLFFYKNQSLTPIDMESLYEDKYFTGWIRAYMEGRNTLIQIEHQFIEESQRVLLLLKEELDQKISEN